MEGAAVLNVLSTQCKALQIIKCYLHVMHLLCCLQDDLYLIERGFKGIVSSHLDKNECENKQSKCVLTHYLFIDVFIHHPHIHIKLLRLCTGKYYL